MGASSSPRLIVLLRGALESALVRGSRVTCVMSRGLAALGRRSRAIGRDDGRRRRRSASRWSGVRLPLPAGRPAAQDDQPSHDRVHRAARPRGAREGAAAAPCSAGSATVEISPRAGARRPRRGGRGVLGARRHRPDSCRNRSRPTGRAAAWCAAAARSRSSWRRTSISRRRRTRCASCAS